MLTTRSAQSRRQRLADASASPLFGAASAMAVEARIADEASHQNAFADTSLHIFTRESIGDAPSSVLEAAGAARSSGRGVHITT